MEADREKPTSGIRLADRAYAELLRRVTVGALEAGERLTEHRLSKMLGMSRTPVREAISRLVADGLLVAIPNCGVTVRELTDEDVVELWYVREAIESQAARLAAPRITDDDLAELYAMCDQMAALTEDDADTLYQGREIDAAFHYRIVELSGVEALVKVYRDHHLLQLQMFGRHWTRLPEYQVPGPKPALGRMHRALVNALAMRDSDVAEAAVRATVRGAIAYHLRMVERYSEERAVKADASLLRQSK